MEQFKTDTHQFIISIDNKDVNSMKHVMDEYLKFGYKKIKEFEYEGNTVLIFAKKIVNLY